MEKEDAELKGEIDFLSQNYQRMNEIGKEKLKEVSEQLLKIWMIVNEEEEVENIKNLHFQVGVYSKGK